MEEKILKALYYVRKKQILQSYHSEYGGRVYSESYVFAVKNDCYPYFHIEEDDEIYSNFYTIKQEFIETVVDYIQKEWLNKRYHTFYELESKYGHENRRNLIILLRYIFLDERFDKTFWDKLIENEKCPIEAFRICAPLDEYEI
ncbi:MAG: hypothetical protein IKJ98_09250 [Bacteroidales bacterium]|nr:hypothetical protein [Bacteroidales bacterium]